MTSWLLRWLGEPLEVPRWLGVLAFLLYNALLLFMNENSLRLLRHVDRMAIGYEARLEALERPAPPADAPLPICQTPGCHCPACRAVRSWVATAAAPGDQS